jgi:hypothetical protein
MYLISCSQDLEKMGLDRMRTKATGMEEKEISMKWSKIRIVPVVANEKAPFQEGEMKVLDIKPIKVPPKTIVLQSFWGVNGMGHINCIGSTEYKPMNQERTADKAMFQSRIKASVLNGDILGQVLLIETI